MEALESGSRIAAQVLGLENELGTIEEGKLADLVVVEGNPMEDVGLLLKPECAAWSCRVAWCSKKSNKNS